MSQTHHGRIKRLPETLGLALLSLTVLSLAGMFALFLYGMSLRGADKGLIWFPIGACGLLAALTAVPGFALVASSGVRGRRFKFAAWTLVAGLAPALCALVVAAK